MFCNKFHAVMKRSQMHPNTTKCTETLVLDPMGWIGCVRWAKSRRDFVARTFALLAVHPVLHRVSSSYETIPNAAKHYATHQNMSLGPMEWIRCVRCQKILTWLRGTNFCINCTSWPRFAPSFMQLRNDPKSSQTLCNAPKHDSRVQWGGLGALVVTNPNVTSCHELLH